MHEKEKESARERRRETARERGRFFHLCFLNQFSEIFVFRFAKVLCTLLPFSTSHVNYARSLIATAILASTTARSATWRVRGSRSPPARPRA